MPFTIGTDVLPSYVIVNESFVPPWFVSSTEEKHRSR